KSDGMVILISLIFTLFRWKYTIGEYIRVSNTLYFAEVAVPNTFPSTTEKALHNYKEALELSDSLIKYQNDEVRIALRQELNSLHRDYYQAQAQIEKARKDIANQRLIIISVSIVILVIMLIWYIRMRRKRYVQEINAHIIAITKLERELRASSSNNATLSEKLHDLLATQFDTLNMVCSNYYDAQQIDERLRIGVYNRIKSELRVISSAASMANIASMVNSCLDNIVDDLKRFYPDISPEDTNLIVLFWAGLSVKSISFLTGVNSNTIYSKRRRWKARFQQLPEPYNGKFVEALR
ncbi:MAG: hypothetical protein K2M65_07840, partial [Muribaculaceae bacterium]|nr:hypothetical protein [Muribaculaceae bacterium]